MITFSRDSLSVLMFFIALFCFSDLSVPFTIAFIFDLIFLIFFLLFLVLYNHPLYFHKNLVES